VTLADTLVLALPGFVLKLVLLYAWLRGRLWFHVWRGCRRAWCHLRGCHDSVLLGLTDGRCNAEIWFACRRCDLCWYMLPGEVPECVWQPRTSLADAYGPHAVVEVPPIVTENGGCP
jgi:hypothetical protein